MRELAMAMGSDEIERMAKEALQNDITRAVRQSQQKAERLAVARSTQPTPPVSEKPGRWWKFWRR